MKKIAIFVEGQTEQIFIAKLVEEFFGTMKVAVETYKMQGGQNNRKIIKLTSSRNNISTDYVVFIYDSSQDKMVKSDIIDNCSSLIRSSFSFIIGIRDAYHDGHPESDIERLKRGLAVGMPIVGIPIKIILAVQEIEAWFLAEETHYAKRSPKLTTEFVNSTITKELKSIVEFDILKDSTEIILHPTAVLQRIYSSVNIGYQKRKSQVERTVNSFDYGNLMTNVRKRNNSFNELLSCLDSIIYETVENIIK